MKEDNRNIFQALSKRAQGFLSTPRHLSAKNPNESVDKKWSWDFSLLKSEQGPGQSDKILTLFYLNKSGGLLEMLFMETLSRMAIGRDIFYLQRLSFREIESFLRDENDLRVFDDSVAICPEESFKMVKNSLLAAILSSEIEKIGEMKSRFKGWKQLTLVEKNQKASSFIALLNKLFSLETPLQMVMADNEKIAIVLNDFPYSAEVLEELIRESFGDGEEISSLKVVAVQ